MPWSNDQLNEIYIYDAQTGDLILSVTSDGLRYQVDDKLYVIDDYGIIASLVPDDGSFGGLVPNGSYEGTRLLLNPPAHDGTAWSSGAVAASQQELAPGDFRAILTLGSPAETGAVEETAQVRVYSRNTDDDVNSIVYHYTQEIRGRENAQMSQGTIDTYTGFSSTNFTAATDTIVDALLGTWYGTGMVDTRDYEARFSGTFLSSIANDRIGLRIYKNASNSMVGATLLADFGQVRATVANVAEPFAVECSFLGDETNQYLILAARRTTGTGTCNVRTEYRRAADISPPG